MNYTITLKKFGQRTHFSRVFDTELQVQGSLEKMTLPPARAGQVNRALYCNEPTLLSASRACSILGTYVPAITAPISMGFTIPTGYWFRIKWIYALEPLAIQR